MLLKNTSWIASLCFSPICAYKQTHKRTGTILGQVCAHNISAAQTLIHPPILCTYQNAHALQA